MTKLDKNTEVVTHRLPDGNLALADADRGVMLVVNAVGEAVWWLADEHSTLEGVTDAIAEQLCAPRKRVHADVSAFVESLREHGLLK